MYISSPNNNYTNFLSFYELISALTYLVENGMKPFWQRKSLFTGINLNNEVGFCLNFGIAPKSNPYTPIYLIVICFLLNESYAYVETRDEVFPIIL